MSEVAKTFESLQLVDTLCDACRSLGWKNPTKIQEESIPKALEGRDVIGLAETGSGKTAAFALPVLQALLKSPMAYFALVVAPTRELAFQISQQFEALGVSIGVKTVTLVGGVDMMTQSLNLARKPHIVVGTPGRIVDHLENTRGFTLENLQFLVLDEADKLLNMDFEEELDKIVKVSNRERQTFLFSATMTSRVAKLQRASLRNPHRVEVNSKYTTVSSLVQRYSFIPAKFKDTYFVYHINAYPMQSMIVFGNTCLTVVRLHFLLKNLGFSVTSLHGKLSQAKRLSALRSFTAGRKNILLATDVASRGLDLPSVQVVVNYDLPVNVKDYIHRVGRTARAGKGGIAINLVTQYDVLLFQTMEKQLQLTMGEEEKNEDEAMLLLERVSEAERAAGIQLRESGLQGGAVEEDDGESAQNGGTKGKKRRKKHFMK